MCCVRPSDGDIQRVIVTHQKSSDYGLGNEEIEDISMVGEGEIREKVGGLKKEFLFSKDFKVSIFFFIKVIFYRLLDT